MGWSRQIPYTMAKFYFFEKVVELFYAHVFTRPRETYSKGEQLGVTFLSGYTAGVICAIVSHQGSDHPYPHDRYPHRSSVVDLRHLQDRLWHGQQRWCAQEVNV